jgi:hypothetical protein
VGDRTSQCEPPLLTTGQVVRVSAGQGRQAEHLEETVGPGSGSVLVQAKEPTGREHVPADGARHNSVFGLLRHPPEAASQKA